MDNNRKIDEEGKLLVGIENSKFFNLLLQNDYDTINDWLLKNWHLKAYCPIRLLSDNAIKE